MLKVGVTGGTGFIGRYLLRDYCGRFEFVVATSQDAPAGIPAGIRCEKTDYSQESFEEIFRGCDAVVHLGAKVPNSVTAVGELSSYFSSISSTQALLEAAVKCGISGFVDLSTVSVYDKTAPMPLSEDSRCAPENCYGISKRAVEMLSGLYEEKYGLRIKTLRVSQVLGYRQYRSRGFFSMLLENSIEGRSLTLFGSGKAARDYIYVRDVAGAIVCALEHPEVSGIYNIGSGRPTSNRALAEAYAAVFQNREGIEEKPVEQEDLRCWYLDISKAERELGFRPQFDLYGMVEDIKKEYGKHVGEDKML